MTNTNQKQDGIEERAEAFGDKEHPCCDGFNCYVCVADFARSETATLTAERDRLKEALRELCEAGDAHYHYQSIGNGAKLNCALDKAKAILNNEATGSPDDTTI